MREGGGNCLKYLKRGWNRKEGSGNKDFKKGGKLGQGVGALKKKGGQAGTPLKTMPYDSIKTQSSGLSLLTRNSGNLLMILLFPSNLFEQISWPQIKRSQLKTKKAILVPTLETMYIHNIYLCSFAIFSLSIRNISFYKNGLFLT